MLIPRFGPARRHVLQRCALATGVADKAVALLYERIWHDPPAAALIARQQGQIRDGLLALDAAKRQAGPGFWGGARPDHGDIAAACTLRFVSEAHPALADPDRLPALAAHGVACEALPAFAAVVQTLIPPR